MSANRIKRVLVLLLLVAMAIWVAMNRGKLDMTILEWVQDTGVWGPVVFIFVGATSTILFVPASVFVFASGVLFGPVWGAVYSLLGACIGAAVSFLLARYIVSDWVIRNSRGRVKQLIEGVEEEGWHFVAFVRLVPIFPFFLLNYALGVTRIKFSPYIIATFVCSIPGVVALTYAGYVGKEVLAGGGSLLQKGVIAIALLAFMFYLPRLAKRLHDKGKL